MPLELRQLGCRKGQQTLFAALDYTLQAGELLHIAGDNGSGKTTLLRVLAGLNRDYTGDALWEGSNIRQCWPDYANQLLYLGHQPALKAQLTATENLDWYATAHGVTAQNIQQALSALGIQHRANLPCHQLSAGQQRRVALCRLLFSHHRLWLLDEPFTALDPRGFATVVDCLREHLARGGMAVLTTHHGMENINLPHRTLLLGDAASTEATT